MYEKMHIYDGTTHLLFKQSCAKEKDGVLRHIHKQLILKGLAKAVFKQRTMMNLMHSYILGIPIMILHYYYWE